MNFTCPKCGFCSKPKPRSEVPYPLSHNIDFVKAWQDWLEHLNQKRKWPTLLAQERQLKKLAAMGPETAVATINYCIERNWQSIFPMQDLPIGPSAKPTRPAAFSTWELRQQAEAIESEIKEIEGRGTQHPLGWEAASEADRVRRQALRGEQRRIRNAMMPEGVRV